MILFPMQMAGGGAPKPNSLKSALIVANVIFLLCFTISLTSYFNDKTLLSYWDWTWELLCPARFVFWMMFIVVNGLALFIYLVFIVEDLLDKKDKKHANAPEDVSGSSIQVNSERYPMCKDQLAQIDCRVVECRWNTGAGYCKNVSPAITLNKAGFATCWTKGMELNK